MKCYLWNKIRISAVIYKYLTIYFMEGFFTALIVIREQFEVIRTKKNLSENNKAQKKK